MHTSTILAVCAITTACPGGLSCAATSERQYTLTTTYNASNFLESFDFIAKQDTYSNGFAQYLSQKKAIDAGLVAKTHDGAIYLGVDSKTVLDPGSSAGRPSIRVESRDEFSRGLLIADIDHVPGNACGIWPAFWLLADVKNDYSEIDIIEGISLDAANEITLFTEEECYVDLRSDMTGVQGNNYCRGPNHDPAVTANDALFEGQGVDRKSCGARASNGTFGDAFNGRKGGVWALLIDENDIKMWFFDRNKIPTDISKDRPDPSIWGTPVINLGPGTCDIATAWKKMKIVINITFCGHWPEGVWDVSGCAARTGLGCRQYVAQNPKDFAESFFSIRSIKIFQ